MVNQYNYIETVIKSDGVDIFKGIIKLEKDKMYLNVLDIFNKLQISPKGIDRHESSRDIILALGENYQR